jgi:hypothetical protein
MPWAIIALVVVGRFGVAVLRPWRFWWARRPLPVMPGFTGALGPVGLEE